MIHGYFKSILTLFRYLFRSAIKGDMVKHELRVESFKARVEIQKCELNGWPISQPKNK